MNDPHILLVTDDNERSNTGVPSLIKVHLALNNVLIRVKVHYIYLLYLCKTETHTIVEQGVISYM